MDVVGISPPVIGDKHKRVEQKPYGMINGLRRGQAAVSGLIQVGFTVE